MKEDHLPLSVKQMIQLQKNDAQAKNIVDKLRKEKDNTKMFIMHDGVLCRLWTEEKETFRCTFVPQVGTHCSYSHITRTAIMEANVHTWL